MSKRLSKAERHDLRREVRRRAFVTHRDIINMPPPVARVVLAEMRKRGYRHDAARCVWLRLRAARAA